MTESSTSETQTTEREADQTVSGVDAPTGPLASVSGGDSAAVASGEDPTDRGDTLTRTPATEPQDVDLDVQPVESIDGPASDAEPDTADAADGADRLEIEGDIAADYLEELLDIADLDGDLDMDVEGDRAAVSIVGGDVRQLVGRNGEVLEALQELTRLAVYRETGERSRLMLDVGGYRADRRSRLEVIAAEAVEEVTRTGVKKSLDPMSPFERKVVHDVVAAAGLQSASEGEEPRRRVVVLPA